MSLLRYAKLKSAAMVICRLLAADQWHPSEGLSRKLAAIPTCRVSTDLITDRQACNAAKPRREHMLLSMQCCSQHKAAIQKPGSTMQAVGERTIHEDVKLVHDAERRRRDLADCQRERHVHIRSFAACVCALTVLTRWHTAKGGGVRSHSRQSLDTPRWLSPAAHGVVATWRMGGKVPGSNKYNMIFIQRT